MTGLLLWLFEGVFPWFFSFCVALVIIIGLIAGGSIWRQGRRLSHASRYSGGEHRSGKW